MENGKYGNEEMSDQMLLCMSTHVNSYVVRRTLMEDPISPEAL